MARNVLRRTAPKVIAVICGAALLLTGCAAEAEPPYNPLADETVAETPAEESPTPEAAPEPTPEPGFPHELRRTETDSLGYVSEHLIEWGDLERGSLTTTHPFNDSFVLGSGCDFDPDKDAVINGRFTMSNATPDFTIDRMHGGVEVATYLGQSGLEAGPFRARIEMMIGGRPTCGLQDYGPNDLIFFEASNVAPGGTIRAAFFIILKDYYQPSRPAGYVEALPYLEVNFSGPYYSSGEGVRLG